MIRLPPAVPFRVAFLDCDSTLSAIEGIDELARMHGVFDEVQDLTRRAMEGDLSLDAVYGLRLRLVQPTLPDVEALGRLYVDRVVDGAQELVSALHAGGLQVHLVSGGIRQALLPLARLLGIAEHRVHAVPLRFGPDGALVGHDESSPLWRSGGKAEACARVLRTSRGPSFILGDGKTDVEARPPCDAAVGFGGVAARDVVRREADAFVEGPSLLGVLEVVLPAAQNARRNSSKESRP